MEVEKESYNYILLRVNTKSQSLPEGYPLPVPSRHFPMLIPFLVFLLIKKNNTKQDVLIERLFG